MASWPQPAQSVDEATVRRWIERFEAEAVFLWRGSFVGKFENAFSHGLVLSNRLGHCLGAEADSHDTRAVLLHLDD